MELLSCPFCGSNDPHLTNEKDFVICDCGVGISIDKWNTRHPQWISVKERLPEENKKVLVSTITLKNEVEAVYYKEGLFLLHGILLDDLITHWMPLPQTPKETK